MIMMAGCVREAGLRRAAGGVGEDDDVDDVPAVTRVSDLTPAADDDTAGWIRILLTPVTCACCCWPKAGIIITGDGCC